MIMSRKSNPSDSTERQPAESTSRNPDRGGISRRSALKAVGVGAASLGVLSGTVAATADASCELDQCTREFLLAEPAIPQAPVQWDGETIANDKSIVKVGAQIEGVDLAAPFAFDPIVTCVQAGTTVRWKWLNQKSVDPDIPVTVLHNVDIFQYSDGGGCTYEEGSFVTSGELVGFNPPEDEDPVKFEYTFEEPGVYPYYCEPHGYPALPGLPEAATDDASHHGTTLPPNAVGMRGAVIVTDKRGKGR